MAPHSSTELSISTAPSGSPPPTPYLRPQTASRNDLSLILGYSHQLSSTRDVPHTHTSPCPLQRARSTAASRERAPKKRARRPVCFLSVGRPALRAGAPPRRGQRCPRRRRDRSCKRHTSATSALPAQTHDCAWPSPVPLIRTSRRTMSVDDVAALSTGERRPASPCPARVGGRATTCRRQAPGTPAARNGGDSVMGHRFGEVQRDVQTTRSCSTCRPPRAEERRTLIGARLGVEVGCWERASWGSLVLWGLQGPLESGCIVVSFTARQSSNRHCKSHAR